MFYANVPVKVSEKLPVNHHDYCFKFMKTPYLILHNSSSSLQQKTICFRDKCRSLHFNFFLSSHKINPGIVKVDTLAWQNISKCHFLKDIENSFYEVTHLNNYFNFHVTSVLLLRGDFRIA